MHLSLYRLAIASLALGLFAPVCRAEAQWFKGNTHTHSLWSDGNDFPEMITDWYVKHGYQFLALSDHNILSRGEKWMTEAAIEKRRITLGRKVLDKYLDRFGADWVVTRTGANGDKEVRLRTLEEIRTQFEKPGVFQMIEAEEVTASWNKVPIHINAINVGEVVEPTKDLATIREVMRANLTAIAEESQRSGKPVLAHINHPNFRWALTAEDLAHVLEDHFFEVYNGHPQTWTLGDKSRPDTATERIWDIANTIRIAELKAPPLYGIGSDDSHHYHGGSSTPGRGWVMVRAEKLEPDAIIRAMQAGDFYASSGVTLDEVSFDKSKGELRVKVEARDGVKHVVEFHGTRKNYDRAVTRVASPVGDGSPERLQHSPTVGGVLARVEGDEAVYTLKGDELFVRATITSDAAATNPSYEGEKQMAWTQPVGW
ncbi:MAG: hypothetical protein KDK97_11320 [Verrucomicrobiales bacterium]|nr:hypothetical protein [Verrucomicrobiales bacterium]MCP5558128.1 hypothetical protein [Verrucomicrobiaceae bacterium]